MEKTKKEIKDKRFNCFKFMNKTNITLDYIKNIAILIVVFFIIGFGIYIYFKINKFIEDVKIELFEPISKIKSEILDFKNDTLYIIDNFENKTITFLEDIPHDIYTLIKNISIF